MQPKSWKTTTLGVCTIVVAVATFLKAFLDNDPNTVPSLSDLMNAIGFLAAGGAGVAAADHANLPK